MKKWQCPICGHALQTQNRCHHCSTKLELKPDFLSTFSSKVLFFSGALLLGSYLPEELTSAGFYGTGVDRVLIDIGLGVAYFFFARFVFSFFQYPTADESLTPKGYER